MRFRQTLTFETDEDVSPKHLAQRVAEACARYGALRPGEAVLVGQTVYTVKDEPTPSPFD